MDNNNGKKKKDQLLIDVRTPKEYASGHVANAINLPIETIHTQLDKIEDWKDKRVVVYCLSGARSNAVARFLKQHDFDEVRTAPGVGQYDYDLVHYTDIRGCDLTILAEDEHSVLVDCRSEECFAAGHLTGARNIPAEEIAKHLDELPIGAKILLYGDEQADSSKVAEILTEKGYQKVYNTIDPLFDKEVE